MLLDRIEELRRLEVTLERFRRLARVSIAPHSPLFHFLTFFSPVEIQHLKEWITVCTEMMEMADLGDSISDTTLLIGDHERFARDSRSQAKIHKELQTVGKLLPANHPEVEATLRELGAVFDPLPQRNIDRMDALQKELAHQRQLEAARLKFFEDIRDFEELLFAAEEYSLHPIEGDSEQTLIAFLDPLKRLAGSIQPHELFSADEETMLSHARARYDGVLPQMEARRAAIREEQQKKKQGKKSLPQPFPPGDLLFADAKSRLILVDELYQKVARAAAQFDLWYTKMSLLISDDATQDLLKQRAKTVQSMYGEGQGHTTSAASAQEGLDALKAVGPNPYTVATVVSLKTQFEHLKKWADERAGALEKPLPTTNAPQVVRDLDFLTQDKGVIDPTELAGLVNAESAEYLKEKAFTTSAGHIDYTKFNPYPDDAPAQRRASVLPIPSPASRRLSVGAGAANQQAQEPKDASKRTSYYGSPSRTRAYSNAGSSDVTSPPMTSPSAIFASVTSPVARAPSLGLDEEDASGLPQFDDSMRKRKEMDENIFLYTTQTTTSPLAVRYEIECNQREMINFNIVSLRATSSF